MRVVRDESNTRYVLLDSEGEECRLRTLPTGTRTTRPCSDLRPIEPAELFDSNAPTSRGTHSSRALALLFELDLTGPASARALLCRFDACESDLHGAATELRAAGLLEPATVHGERGYRTTEAASDLLEQLS